MLAKVFRHDVGRDDLNKPVPIELACYHESARDLHNRLTGEFGKALDLMEQGHKEHGCEPRAKKVLPFPSS